jgi:hypothetical protein
MSKEIAIFAMIALSATAAAPAALAQETTQMAMTETQQIEPETMESRVVEVPADRPRDVMSTVETSNLIAVEGPDGRIYYNHIVPISDLPDPELDLRIIATYDVSYEGAVYTNKIVQEID